jgi:hypothetical protein
LIANDASLCLVVDNKHEDDKESMLKMPLIMIKVS